MDASVYSCIATFAGELVRISTVGGQDDCTPALHLVHERLQTRGVASEIITLDDDPIALIARAGKPGSSALCLNACIDTATVGDRDAWTFDPLAGDVVDGWLRGRGSADSKLAVAMFTQLMCDHDPDAPQLTMLLDADEHTGNFGGAMAAAKLIDAPDVIIGYPGKDRVCTGARGLVRCNVHVSGTAMHSGSSRRRRDNAAVHAARLVVALEDARNGLPTDHIFAGMSGEITVTGMTAGTSFSQVPDTAIVQVDMRTTGAWTAQDALAMIERAASMSGAQCKVETLQTWLPYVLADDHPFRMRMIEATNHLEDPPTFQAAGPSNIGNWLTGEGFNVLCGFGVSAQGVHGADERACLDDLPAIFRAYQRLIGSYT